MHSCILWIDIRISEKKPLSIKIGGPSIMVILGLLRELSRPERQLQGLKDGPGPVMVSDTLCPAIHILGT